MDDRYIAYVLYKEGVSGQTVSRWKKEGEWEKKATDDLMAMQTIHEDIRDLVRYQLVQLKKLKEAYAVSTTEDGKVRLITKGDIDGVRDLYNMIREKETDWTLLVRTVRKVNKYLKDNHPELAKEVAPLLNDFLNEERSAT